MKPFNVIKFFQQLISFRVVQEGGGAAPDTVDQQILKSLAGLNARMKQLDDIQEAVKKNAADYDSVITVVDEVKKQLDEARRAQIEIKSGLISRTRSNGTPGDVSEGCARFLGALGLIAALKAPGADLTHAQKDMCSAQIKNILGMEMKAALTSADIPLPTQYSGDIVELVYQFGQARKYGTVFPLGSGVVKLPKLTTDTTWGLIASSGSVTEKSPQIAFVTFTAEKFGGLIRLPSEIDEDSIVAMGQFIARYAARQIAYVEDWQFFRSTGADSGINGAGAGLTTAVVTDGCVYNQSGSATGAKTKQSDATLADFRNLRGASTLSGVVLGKAKYYMHPTYEALLVSFNTSATVTPYLRSNGTAPATLDGFEIVWTNVMPAYSTVAAVSLCHVLFGDVSFQYLGLRGGFRFDTSREAAFTTDEILIRGLERMTVALMASKAVAGLVTDAS